MARKPAAMLFELSEFRSFMYAKMSALGYDPAQYASVLGISKAAVYALLSGTLTPSDKIVDAVGLEYVFRVKAQQPDLGIDRNAPADPIAKKAAKKAAKKKEKA